MMCNAYWEPLEFELPVVAERAGGPWRRWIDTSLDSPQDIVPWNDAPPVSGGGYKVAARTVAVLYTGGR